MKYAILAAGGKGIRFGASKQFHPLEGKPLFLWSVERFRSEKSIDDIVFVYPADEEAAEYAKLADGIRFVKGGPSRYESVRNGFNELEAKEDDLILIHDVARPLLSAALLRDLLEAAKQLDAVIPAIPVQETVKEVIADRITRTVSRTNLWLAQTPQAFRYKILKTAYDHPNLLAEPFTDEAAMVEHAGFAVHVIAGERSNIKITKPEDIRLAEFFLKHGGIR